MNYLQICRGKNPIIIFLDLPKSFVTIEYTILIHKLKLRGLNMSLSLINNYIAERMQFVEFNDIKLNLFLVNIGVSRIYFRPIVICNLCE